MYECLQSAYAKLLLNLSPVVEKMYLKMLSAACRQTGGPRLDCCHRSSPMWVHTVCYKEVINGLAGDAAEHI